jgi:hypothetical protein
MRKHDAVQQRPFRTSRPLRPLSLRDDAHPLGRQHAPRQRRHLRSSASHRPRGCGDHRHLRGDRHQLSAHVRSLEPSGAWSPPRKERSSSLKPADGGERGGRTEGAEPGGPRSRRRISVSSAAAPNRPRNARSPRSRPPEAGRAPLRRRRAAERSRPAARREGGPASRGRGRQGNTPLPRCPHAASPADDVLRRREAVREPHQEAYEAPLVSRERRAPVEHSAVVEDQHLLLFHEEPYRRRQLGRDPRSALVPRKRRGRMGEERRIVDDAERRLLVLSEIEAHLPRRHGEGAEQIDRVPARR